MRKKAIFKGAVVLLVAIAMVFSSIAIANTNEINLQTKGSNTQNEIKYTPKEMAISGSILWDNGRTVPDSNLLSSQKDNGYPFVSQVADDFHFDEDTEIFDVHWFGGFWGGPPEEVDPCKFNIYFYLDDGTGTAPTGAGMPDPAPTAIASYSFPAVTGYPLDPNGFYSYEVDLDPPFLAIACEKYWIAIQAEFDFPPQWGWANTDQYHLATAVQGFPVLEMPFWTMIDPEVDMAFYLTGQCGGVGELCCDPGLLRWTDVPAGSTQTGSFYVWNCGEECSDLIWKVDSWPEWGTWKFTPPGGTLAAGDGVTVDVKVVAPPDINTAFSGNVTVINVDNPANNCIMQTDLVTPKAKTYHNTFLLRLFEIFPNAFPVLKQLLGL
jgi:hypothetical protein